MSPVRAFALPIALVAALAAVPACAAEPPRNPQIDYPGFVELAEDGKSFQV